MMKQIPYGLTDFARIQKDNYYYVDKTLLIRDFLNAIPMVSLFTRPRRFGKTLNMDMLRVFFEKTPKIHLFILRISIYGSVGITIQNIKVNIL